MNDSQMWKVLQLGDVVYKPITMSHLCMVTDGKQTYYDDHFNVYM